MNLGPLSDNIDLNTGSSIHVPNPNFPHNSSEPYLTFTGYSDPVKQTCEWCGSKYDNDRNTCPQCGGPITWPT